MTLTPNADRPVRRAALHLVATTMLGLLVAGCAARNLPVGETSGQSQSAASILKDIRTGNGLAELSPDPGLEAAALTQARYMAQAGKMAHTTGFGRDFASRMRAARAAMPAAENVAVGRFDQKELFERWMASPGHRRNMLDPAMHRYGLASAASADGARRYWALVLSD